MLINEHLMARPTPGPLPDNVALGTDSIPHHTARAVHVVTDVNQSSDDVITISSPIWVILLAVSGKFSRWDS